MTKPKDDPMNDLLKMFLTNKGTRSYRTLLIAIVCYVGFKVNEVDRRLANIETRLTQAHIAQAGAEDNHNIGEN